MVDQQGVLNARIHHAFKILLTAQLRRQLETKPIRGCQTFPSPR